MSKTVVSFVAANEESLAVLDAVQIQHTATPDGIDIAFPGHVQISSDQDETSQPSYYVYQVGAERFVYLLGPDTLVVE